MPPIRASGRARESGQSKPQPFRSPEYVVPPMRPWVESLTGTVQPSPRQQSVLFARSVSKNLFRLSQKTKTATDKRRSVRLLDLSNRVYWLLSKREIYRSLRGPRRFRIKSPTSVPVLPLMAAVEVPRPPGSAGRRESLAGTRTSQNAHPPTRAPRPGRCQCPGSSASGRSPAGRCGDSPGT
jgi:hypothetical protein